MKLTLPFLETMITQSCNLSCLGCTNYSDLKHSGYVTWRQGKEWLSAWLDRVTIPDFGIMGGEPLINPEVEKWLLGVRELLPDSQIRFTTNGLLLHKYPNLIDLLYDIGNVVFKITVHVENENLENQIKKIMSTRHWDQVTEYDIVRWKTDNNLRLQINRPSFFIKTYRNDYHAMMPHHSDPKDSFSQCIQQTCPLLYNKRIYKCSTAGLLKDTLSRFKNPNFDQWLPYIDDGIGVDSSLEDLTKFIENFGKPNSICGQCPDHFSKKIYHLSNVKHAPIRTER